MSENGVQQHLQIQTTPLYDHRHKFQTKEGKYSKWKWLPTRVAHVKETSPSIAHSTPSNHPRPENMPYCQARIFLIPASCSWPFTMTDFIETPESWQSRLEASEIGDTRRRGWESARYVVHQLLAIANAALDHDAEKRQRDSHSVARVMQANTRPVEGSCEKCMFEFETLSRKPKRVVVRGHCTWSLASLWQLLTLGRI